jgi:hypothetical protein
MKSRTTAQVVIEVCKPDSETVYGLLRLNPEIDSGSHYVDVRSFSVRRGDDRFSLEDMPVGRTMFKAATDDIVYHTFEAEGEDRAEYFEIEYRIRETGDSILLPFRAVEKAKLPDFLFYQVEDQAGDWLPLEDVCLVELLSDSFTKTLEMVAMDLLTDHNMSHLPMHAES